MNVRVLVRVYTSSSLPPSSQWKCLSIDKVRRFILTLLAKVNFKVQKRCAQKVQHLCAHAVCCIHPACTHFTWCKQKWKYGARLDVTRCVFPTKKRLRSRCHCLNCNPAAEILMAIMYSLTTPMGVGLGIMVSSHYTAVSSSGLIVQVTVSLQGRDLINNDQKNALQCCWDLLKSFFTKFTEGRNWAKAKTCSFLHERCNYSHVTIKLDPV